MFSGEHLAMPARADGQSRGGDLGAGLLDECHKGRGLAALGPRGEQEGESKTNLP